MELIDRIWRGIRANSLVAEAQDPEKVLSLIVRNMHRSLMLLRQAGSQAI
ncbi:MAG: hypothetical protein GDA56_28275 [Hormoscilla sp. GM7CHS1pb]|nr:hypothetical protein [Hormoscilla sp. GM7CHS1pb]